MGCHKLTVGLPFTNAAVIHILTHSDNRTVPSRPHLRDSHQDNAQQHRKCTCMWPVEVYETLGVLLQLSYAAHVVLSEPVSKLAFN